MSVDLRELWRALHRARDLLEEALGHQIANAVERAYRRTDSFERRRAVMEAWADYCTGKPSGKIRA